MLTLDELKALAAQEKINTVYMAFSDHMGRQMGKRYDVDFFLESGVHGSHACEYLMTVDMDFNIIPGFAFTNWCVLSPLCSVWSYRAICPLLLVVHMIFSPNLALSLSLSVPVHPLLSVGNMGSRLPNFLVLRFNLSIFRERGYGDFQIVPEMSTLRVASWLDKTAHVICDVVNCKTGKPVSVAPRSVLLDQVNKARALGYQGVGASELEYFMYKDSYEEAHKKGYKGLEHFGYYLGDYHMLQSTREEKLNAVMRHELKKSGIPIENSKGEYGLGQHELNVKYADVLTMSDRHMVYKTCFKEVSQRLGMSVTFMAKPHASQSGSSCHLHVNLSNLNGENLFAGNDELEGIKCSETFRHFLGGWIRHTPDLMPFYAPTINSYKRFAAASWAPTRLAWSADNRTAGFRIVGEGKSLRIECRLPGADANPYLAFAAAMASGIDGIVNKIEPTRAGAGNFYLDDTSTPVPNTLQEATKRFRNSEFARRAFGDDVVDHYAHFYQLECDSYDKAVTDWERIRYFEQV